MDELCFVLLFTFVFVCQASNLQVQCPGYQTCPDDVGFCSCWMKSHLATACTEVICEGLTGDQLKTSMSKMDKPIYELWIRSYKHKELPRGFLSSRNVSNVLVMNNERLTILQKQVFGTAKDVQSVSIVMNPELTKIHRKAFTNLRKLKTLNLSWNQKLRLQDLNLEKQPLLTTIYMVGDNLSTFKLSQHPKVVEKTGTLYLQGNPLDCSCPMLWIRQVWWDPASPFMNLRGTCSTPSSHKGRLVKDLSLKEFGCE